MQPHKGHDKKMEGGTMTEQQTINLILKAPDTPDEDLTAEEQAFLQKHWEDLTPEEQALYHAAWRQAPGTIEHAAATAGCTQEEMKSAARVIRAMLDRWKEDGASQQEIDGTSVQEFLTAIEREARQCRL